MSSRKAICLQIVCLILICVLLIYLGLLQHQSVKVEEPPEAVDMYLSDSMKVSGEYVKSVIDYYSDKEVMVRVVTGEADTEYGSECSKRVYDENTERGMAEYINSDAAFTTRIEQDENNKISMVTFIQDTQR